MNKEEEKEIKEEIREVKEALKWLSRKSAEKMYKIDSRVQKQIKMTSDKMSKHLDDVDKDRRKKMQEIRYIGVEFELRNSMIPLILTRNVCFLIIS